MSLFGTELHPSLNTTGFVPKILTNNPLSHVNMDIQPEVYDQMAQNGGGTNLYEEPSKVGLKLSGLLIVGTRIDHNGSNPLPPKKNQQLGSSDMR